jgi:3-oxoacyl-[acyl-carrier-protein] synthase-3
LNKLKSAGIIGTGSYVPEREVTNFDMEEMVDTSDEWIVSRTGIKSRRFADDETATSDLALEASKKALKDADITAEDLDLIIVATITPDMSFPATACIIQDKLGATHAAAFDLSAACSGFLYGLTVANQMIASGLYENILVIGAETLSKILDFEDRNTCVLFGDGAGAVVMGPVEDGRGVLSTDLGSDGSGGMALHLPAGGSRNPATIETVKNKMHYVQMEGSEVFKFAVRAMGRASKKVIKEANLKLEDVDYLVPHQANIRIIQSAAKKIKLPMDKVKVNLDQYGNISAGSIPIALDEAIKEGKINKGDNIVLVGFGGGLTWGACLIKW